MNVNMNPIKIIFLKKKELKRDGVATYQNSVLRLFKNIPKCKLIIVDDDFEVKSKLLNYIFQSIPPLRIIKFLLRYMYLAIKIRKHIKHVDYLFIPTSFRYGFLAILISSLFKIPFIVPLLGYEEKELRLRGASKIEIFLKLKYEYMILRKAKYILSSEDLIKGYEKLVKNKNAFLSIDSPADINKFKPMLKSEILKNKLKVNNKKVILTVTSLDGDKSDGLKILLEAFVFIKKEYNNVVLLIAGDGPKRKEFEDVVKKMNEKDDIRLLGYWDNIVELINLSDVFVLIFLVGGGIGAATKEAMACEKPCIVVRTSGTEVLNDGKEVLLTSLDPKDIADKIMLLLKDENYARRIGINARKRIEADYSLKKAEEKLVKKLSGEEKN